MNSIFKELLSKATTDGKAEPLLSVHRKAIITTPTLIEPYKRKILNFAITLPGFGGLATKSSNKSITGAAPAEVAFAEFKVGEKSPSNGVGGVPIDKRSSRTLVPFDGA